MLYKHVKQQSKGFSVLCLFVFTDYDGPSISNGSPNPQINGSSTTQSIRSTHSDLSSQGNSTQVGVGTHAWCCVWCFTWKSVPSCLLSVFYNIPSSWRMTRAADCWTRSLRWAWALRQQKKSRRSMPKKRRRRHRWTGWRNTSCSATSETSLPPSQGHFKHQRTEMWALCSPPRGWVCVVIHRSWTKFPHKAEDILFLELKCDKRLFKLFNSSFSHFKVLTDCKNCVHFC